MPLHVSLGVVGPGLVGRALLSQLADQVTEPMQLHQWHHVYVHGLGVA